MKIHESAENYLETILVLSKRKQFVRSIDIVNELNFSKPSVSVAMKHLREDGYIVMDADGYITLSNIGYEIANRIYERHQLISTILIEIGVDSETAKEEACRIEHDISQDTFEKLKNWLLQNKIINNC